MTPEQEKAEAAAFAGQKFRLDGRLVPYAELPAGMKRFLWEQSVPYFEEEQRKAREMEVRP